MQITIYVDKFSRIKEALELLDLDLVMEEGNVIFYWNNVRFVLKNFQSTAKPDCSFINFDFSFSHLSWSEWQSRLELLCYRNQVTAIDYGITWSEVQQKVIWKLSDAIEFHLSFIQPNMSLYKDQTQDRHVSDDRQSH